MDTDRPIATARRGLTALRAEVGSRAQVVSPAGRLVGVVGVVGWIVGWKLGWIEGMWIAAGAAVVLLCATIFLLGSADLEVDVSVDPKRVTVGDAVDVQMVVRNVGAHRLFPLRMELTVGANAPIFDVPSLAPGAEHPESFVLLTRRRQIIPIGPATSVRGDPLGMMRRTVDWTEPVPLFVHPRIVRLDNLGAGFLRDLEGQPTADLSDNDVAFHTLREYQPGDDRRFVHWKTTARVGTLMIRQFVDTRRSHLAILLDTQPSSYANDDEFELAVSVAGSLGARALVDEQEVTMWSGSVSLEVRHGQHLLDNLAGVERSPTDHTLVQQAIQANRSGAGVSIVAMVTGSEASLAEARAAANRFDGSVRLFVLRADEAGTTGIRGIGAATVLNVAALEEFPHLMWKGTQW